MNPEETLTIVRRISGGARIKRQYPIHVGVSERRPEPKRKLEYKTHACGCRETESTVQGELIPIKLRMVNDSQCRHDCQYIKERNDYMESVLYDVHQRALIKLAEVMKDVPPGMKSDGLLTRFQDMFLTEAMNQFRSSK